MGHRPRLSVAGYTTVHLNGIADMAKVIIVTGATVTMATDSDL
jgi:hypothetical protein